MRSIGASLAWDSSWANLPAHEVHAHWYLHSIAEPVEADSVMAAAAVAAAFDHDESVLVLVDGAGESDADSLVARMGDDGAAPCEDGGAFAGHQGSCIHGEDEQGDVHPDDASAGQEQGASPARAYASVLDLCDGMHSRPSGSSPSKASENGHPHWGGKASSPFYHNP